MGCNCGKKSKYEVTTSDGAKTTVDTLTAALALVRSKGGHYQRVKV